MENEIDNVTWINSSCPLCNSEKGVLLHKYVAADAPLSMLSTQDDRFIILVEEIESIWQDRHCYYVRCNNCSLIYATPFKAGNAKVYGLIYATTGGYTKWKWEYEEAFNSIKEYIGSNTIAKPYLLEIGAGNGAFVKKISEQLVDPKNIVTTELSTIGRTEIIKHGIECSDSEIKDLCTSSNKERFNFICLFQVLEHLDNLHEIFTSVDYLLDQKGLLIVAVPNSFHREYFERMDYYDDIPPVHISRWSYESFTHLGHQYDFKILEHSIEPNKLHKNLSKYFRFKYQNSKIIKWTNNIENKHYRNIIKALLFTFLTLLNIRIIHELSNKKYGISQLIVFQKLK
jgi:2-polyprenyl-3-methyl-5-hydroxy-6-metoxy-1,4-benzoquinol methylase